MRPFPALICHHWQPLASSIFRARLHFITTVNAPLLILTLRPLATLCINLLQGTAALYYYWQRIPSQPHPFAPRSRTQQGPSPFLLARASGVLLPNETHTVEVDFMPQHA
eukprot:scaffold50042_cov19-Tisochrysis_lutea.AAC.1